MKKRSWGGGTLENRNGIYLARWVVDGRRYTRSTGCRDRRTAERILAELTAPFRLATDEQRVQALAAKAGGIRDEIERIRSRQPGIAIADAWQTYVTAPERPDTCNAIRLGQRKSKWQNFVSFLANRYPEIVELRNVGRGPVTAFLAEIEKHTSADTYNQYVYAMREVWRILSKIPGTQLAKESPFDKIAHKRVITTSRRALTTDEMVRVCTSVEGEMRILFAIGVYTGLRLGDAATLEWKCIDTARRRIDLVPKKTRHHGTSVTIPIHHLLLAVLLETPPEKRCGSVMPEIAALYHTGNKGRCLLARRIRDVFRSNSIETECDAPDNGRKRTLVGFHSLRHSAVSLMANAGAPLAVVQRIVGHTTAAMTSHYFHETDAALNAAVGAMPNVLGTEAPHVSPSLPDATQGNLAALEAIADRMTKDELTVAISRLRERLHPQTIETSATSVKPAA